MIIRSESQSEVNLRYKGVEFDELAPAGEGRYEY
jgi:hypothetical protein